MSALARPSPSHQSERCACPAEDSCDRRLRQDRVRALPPVGRLGRRIDVPLLLTFGLGGGAAASRYRRRAPA